MSTSQTASNSGNPFIFSYSKSLFRCLDVPVQKSFFGLPLINHELMSYHNFKSFHLTTIQTTLARKSYSKSTSQSDTVNAGRDSSLATSDEPYTLDEGGS